MANNKAFDELKLAVACTAPAVPNAGDAVLYGIATGVALTDEDTAGLTSVDFGAGVWRIPVTDTIGGVTLGASLFLDAAGVGLSNTATGFFFGYALETVGIGATATIMVAHIPSPGAGTLGAGTIATAHLAAGILSADADGRAKMANDYFDSATLQAKIDVGALDTAALLSAIPTDAFTNAFLLQAVLNGAFQNDAGTRALFADYIWTEAKIALNSLTGAVVASVADANVIGGIPVLHRIDIADGAGNTDVTLTHKTMLVDAWVLKTNGAGGAGDTVKLHNLQATTDITDAASLNIADKSRVNFSTYDDAQTTINAGQKLRVTAAHNTDNTCVVYVLGIRVA